jgi:hypothetical protein
MDKESEIFRYEEIIENMRFVIIVTKIKKEDQTNGNKTKSD